MHCFFVSDLHGEVGRYQKLFTRIVEERPAAVFLGGDLLPLPEDEDWRALLGTDDFVSGFLVRGFQRLATVLGTERPRVLLILGNRDLRLCEPAIEEAAALGTWDYVHGRRVELGPHAVYGYANTPPSPLTMKDWERYDVERACAPGQLAPEAGDCSVPISTEEIAHGTLRDDLAALLGGADLSQAILLCHAPPFDTALDQGTPASEAERASAAASAAAPASARAAPLGGTGRGAGSARSLGSRALRAVIEERQPMLGLHGHIHEAARLTGRWQDRIGRTLLFTAAHDGPELALVRFDTEFPRQATRELL